MDDLEQRIQEFKEKYSDGSQKSRDKLRRMVAAIESNIRAIERNCPAQVNITRSITIDRFTIPAEIDVVFPEDLKPTPTKPAYLSIPNQLVSINALAGIVRQNPDTIMTRMVDNGYARKNEGKGRVGLYTLTKKGSIMGTQDNIYIKLWTHEAIKRLDLTLR